MLQRGSRQWAWLVVVLGIVAVELWLHGPSLLGQKLLLPCDLLAQKNVRGELIQGVPASKSFVHFDVVSHWEIARSFMAKEFRAGRIPVWNPLGYTGVPFAGFGKFSPFNALRILWDSPYANAWSQLLKSLVIGLGMYAFLRGSLRLSPGPAWCGACALPAAAFFVVWQGDPISDAAAWLPLLIAAVHATVRRPAGWGIIVLATATWACVVAGHLDISAQALVAAGFYGLWRLEARRRKGGTFTGPVMALAAGFAIGLFLAAPYVLPMVKHSATSKRFAERHQGLEDRPPGHWQSLPQAVFAEWDGSHRPNTVYSNSHSANLHESAGAASVGIIATLVLAPLAFSDRRRRGTVRFLFAAGVLSLAWPLGIPGIVSILRLPWLNAISHNRWTFVFAFAVVALAAIGLQVIWQQRAIKHKAHLLAMAALAVLAAAACWRAQDLSLIQDENIPAVILANAVKSMLACTFLAVAGLGAWAVAYYLRSVPMRRILLGGALVLEPLWFATGYTPQSDPSLYYPRVPALEFVSQSAPGRVLPVGCLHASIPSFHGLQDVRGYDGIDPLPILDLMDSCRDPRHAAYQYARVQEYIPFLTIDEQGALRLPAGLSALNVSYIVLLDNVQRSLKPLFRGNGLVVYSNPRAMPRVHVPPRVVEMNGPETLKLLSSPDADPRQFVALLNAPNIPMPEVCRGSARIVAETPAQVEIAATMETAGVVVLADHWADGWSVTVDGKPDVILRANYATRAVALPAGEHTLVFRYVPPGWTLACTLAGIGAVGLAGWAAWLTLRSRRRATSGSPIASHAHAQ